MAERMTTTNGHAKISLSIDPALWQEFRVACLARRTSASAVVGGLIRARLVCWQAEDARVTAAVDEEYGEQNNGHSQARPAPEALPEVLDPVGTGFAPIRFKQNTS